MFEVRNSSTAFKPGYATRLRASRRTTRPVAGSSANSWASAVGVSGGDAEQDQRAADAGVRAFTPGQ
jgi:hypothetical protein